MKSLVASLGALGVICVAASLSSAQQCWGTACRVAPDACAPGYFCPSPCGMTYGPSYNLRPPFPPFQGMVPGPKQEGCPPFMTPTHPYARGPRDYFMLEK